jgi:hypothetical protein
MGIGLSLILIAVGAILAWAVDYQVAGLDINAAGAILMIVGAIGLVLSLLLWNSLGTWVPGGEVRRRRTVYRDEPVDDVVIDREPAAPVSQRTVTRETNYADPALDPPPVRRVR